MSWLKQDIETVLVRPPETARQETSIKGNVTRRQRIGLGFVGKGRAGDSWPEEYRTTVSGEGGNWEHLGCRSSCCGNAKRTPEGGCKKGGPITIFLLPAASLWTLKRVLYRATPNFSWALFLTRKLIKRNQKRSWGWTELSLVWLNSEQIKMFTDSLINKWVPLDVTLMNGASRCFQ